MNQIWQNIKIKTNHFRNVLRYRFRYDKKFRWGSAVVSALLIVAVILSLLPGNRQGAFAGTYTWSQSAWNGGADTVNGAVRPTNDTNWTKYDSKDAGIAIDGSNKATLAATNANTTHTLDADFSGTNSNTGVAGDAVQLAGSANTYTLTQTNDDAPYDDTTTPKPSYQTGSFKNRGDAPFSTSGMSNTTINGTGVNASVVLTKVVDTGTGTLGSFNPSLGNVAGGCYSSWGMTWADPVCTINTNNATYSGTYNFTDITIPTGKTLTASGTNILTLKATGAVSVSGQINVNGGNGANSVTGGTGKAGGGNGGNGGSSAGVPGSNGTGTGKGYGGSACTGSCGDGGGGGYGGAGGAGTGAGSGGIANNDPAGSGGGGSGYGGGGSGSGAGAGGGGLKINGQSVAIDSTGNILANGGAGALSAAGVNDSGGGSGGYISLTTVSTIANNGNIQANGGNGYGSSGGRGGGGKISYNANISGNAPTVTCGSGHGTCNNGASTLTYTYNANGAYTSYVDAGANANYVWNTFAWAQNGQSGASGTITVKVKSMPTTTPPAYFTTNNLVDGTACADVTSGASLSGNACISSSDQYLFYQVTLTSASPYTATPSFDSATVNVTSLSYQTSGTYTSPVIDTGHVQAWGQTIFNTSGSGATIAVRERSCNDASCVGEPAIATCAAVTTGSDPSGNGCVNDGDRYIQYQVTFTGGSGSATPSLNDITLNYSSYVAGDSTLTSSPFNTGDQHNALNRISWTDTGTGGTAKFQVRTADSQADLAAAPWCGPDNGASGTCDSTTYFTTADGSQQIDDLNSDKSGDQWIQYKMFLTSDDGYQAPTISNVSMQYNFNEQPSLAVGTTTESGANVNVNYTISDVDVNDHAGQASQNVVLGYQMPGVILNSADVTSSSTTNILINNPNLYTLPTAGNILIDNELIGYTGNQGNGGNLVTLTGITRAQNFAASYATVGAAHIANAAVYFQATQLSGTNSYGAVTGVTTAASATKTITWNAKNEPGVSASISGNTFTGANQINFKIFANDGFTDAGLPVNNVGSASPAAADLDFQAPTFTAVHVQSNNADTAKAKAGDTLTLTFTSSETLAGLPTATIAGHATTVTNPSGNNYSATYVMDPGDTEGNVAFNINTFSDTAGNAGTAVSVTSDSSAVTFDHTAPTADVTYSINHPVKSGDSLVITATFSEDMANSPIPKIALTGANTLAATNMTKVDATHYTYTRTVGAGNGTATVALSMGTDTTGNVVTAAPSSGADFEVDNTAPTDPGQATLNSYLNNTGNQTVSWTQTTETNFADYLIQRKTGTGGTFETIRTENNNSTTSYADNSALAEDSYYYRVIAEDTAGNTNTGATSDALTVDKTAPVLDHFTSTTANSDPNDANTWKGTGDTINIQAVFAENLAAGSTMTVALTATGNPTVTLDQVSDATLSGTYTVVYGQNSADLGIASISSASVTDSATNNQTNYAIPSGQNLSDRKDIYVDTTGPELTSFSATSGAHKLNDVVTITATYNKTIKAGGSIEVNLNTNHAATLTNGVNRTTLTGTYTVQAGDNADLEVSSISAQNVTDLKNNPLTGTDMPATNIANVIIDTTDPAASFSDNVETGPVQSDDAVINVTETHPGSYKYIFSSDSDCSVKSDGAYAAGENFSSGGTITLNDENNNGKYLCARIADLAGNKIYLASDNKLNIDATAPIADSVKLDRSADSDQLQFSGVADKNADGSERGLDGLQMRIQTLAGETDPCDLSSASYENYAASVTLDNPSSVLKACVQFKDVAGNESDVYSTYTPENPGNFKATDISNLDLNPPFRGVFLTWQIPDVIGEGGIDYFELKECSTGSDQTSCVPDTVLKTVPYADPVQNYDYSHNDLAADTKYCYDVRFKDNHGNYSKYSSVRCIVPGSGAGKLTSISTPPNPPAVLTDKKAVITFDTDQPAKCTIAYGTMQGPDNYTEVPVSESDYNTNHSIHLPGLVFSTEYYYQINCADSGKTAIASPEYSFTTLPKQVDDTSGNGDGGADTTAPEISKVSVSNITGDSATVTWDTNEKSNSLVKFGVTSIDEDVAGNAIVNFAVDNYVTSHSVIIHNLIPATKYKFLAGSVDAAGNIAQSSESSFSTKAPSSLSSIQVVSKNLNQAIITWNTDQSTSSVVEYGLTTAYGDNKTSSTATKTHQITLADLKSKTLYHFRVLGKDSSGNLYSSSDYTFTPKSPPQIDNNKVDSVTEHGAVITFTTDVPTDALVTYADLGNADDTGAQGKPELTSKHSIELKNLTSGTTFSLKIRVRDEAGNETEENFPNFTTGKDTTPPKIDNVKTDSALAQNDKVQSIISWVTDEPATTSLVYSEGRNGEQKTANVNGGYVTNHVIVVTSFKPGTVYYFKVKSVDQANNEATSEDFALLTPRIKENIVQIIIGNFQDIFSWAKLGG